MIISAIAALNRAGVIGDGNGLPWHLPSDMKRFRAHTMGCPMIMGRRTFTSMAGPLPGRLNIVMTRGRNVRGVNVETAGSYAEALGIAESYLIMTGGLEAFVIGGGAVYGETVESWDRMILTVVEGEFPGDVRFPFGQAAGLRWGLAGFKFHPKSHEDRHPHTMLDLRRLRSRETRDLDFHLESWMSRDLQQ